MSCPREGVLLAVLLLGLSPGLLSASSVQPFRGHALARHEHGTSSIMQRALQAAGDVMGCMFMAPGCSHGEITTGQRPTQPPCSGARAASGFMLLHQHRKMLQPGLQEHNMAHLNGEDENRAAVKQAQATGTAAPVHDPAAVQRVAAFMQTGREAVNEMLIEQFRPPEEHEHDDNNRR